ncbi:uncharacterized protein LOC124922463 [Impatiens glandulifera]|uniref:uncharacterized protein LOC124922463 n=1 Tax=Impatiens glandulifera TaxID=253017 RepID=UPI001FB0DAF7|nr:uncharacterized protein LOC124922463 [Impatiens glandulifera]
MFLKSAPPCFQWKYSVNLVFHNGTTKIIMGKHVAREIMFQFPDMMICPADSFFINSPVPILSIDEYLIPGQTYFILPLNLFSSSSHLISISSIVALATTPNKVITFNKNSFELIKGSNGRALIKLSPEFLTGVLIGGRKGKADDDDDQRGEELLRLCSTPELKKLYEQLVGIGKQRNVWLPKLETISEYNNNNNNVKHFSGRLRLLEWKKQRELLKNIHKFKLSLHLLSRLTPTRFELSCKGI